MPVPSVKICHQNMEATAAVTVAAAVVVVTVIAATTAMAVSLVASTVNEAT